MRYLIKILFFLILASTNIIYAEVVNNKILFQINDKVFTDIDLEKRVQYIIISNNLDPNNIDKSVLNEILDDYISVLIFYEYYTVEKIKFKNLKEETENIYKDNVIDKLKNLNLNNEKLENIKNNLYIDIIRRKIIESLLNVKENIFEKETNLLDLIYNYNLSYLTIKENEDFDFNLKDIKDRGNFNELIKKLSLKNISFLYKSNDINKTSILSNLIKKIIKNNQKIYFEKKNEYITIISLEKNLESYDAIFVKLISFNTDSEIEKNNLNCDNIKNLVNIKKKIYKEYEYKKLNDQVKNNLKSANDYIIYKNNNTYNYIMLCELRYDEEILHTINLNKKIDSLATKIQFRFLNKYKNEYNFKKNK